MNNFLYIDESNVKHNLCNLKQLVFEVTDLCNLRCKYCGFGNLYQAYNQREGRKLSFLKAKQIIDYLILLWREAYSPGTNYPVTISFYGGEPMINMLFIKETIDYLKQIQNIGKCFNFSMTTNAMLLDKNMDYLVKNNFSLLISLDGNEYAHSYREDKFGINSFEQVFRNVKKLQTKYPDYFSENVMFNSVLHDRNNADSIYRFIKGNFHKIPSISPLNNSGIREEKVIEFKAMYQNPLQNIYHSNNCKSTEDEIFIYNPRIYSLAKYIQHQSGNVFDNYNDLLLYNSDYDFPPTGTCIPFSKKMFISATGEILPCERINHDFTFGKVYENHVELDFKKVAEQHNSFVFKFISQCNRCAINRQCNQCVYQNDDIRKENVNCYTYCNQEEFDRRNAHMFDFLNEHPDYYERILEEVVIKKI